MDFARADLSLEKIVTSGGAPMIGDDATFRVTVTNQGPDNTDLVKVLDLLPSGYDYKSNTTTQGSYDPLSGEWDIGYMAEGATVTMDVVATVLETGDYNNRAEVIESSVFDPDSTPGDGVGDESASSSVTPLPAVTQPTGGITIVPNAPILSCPNVLVNGDFEDTVSGTFWGVNRAGAGTINGWTAAGGGTDTYAAVNSGGGSVSGNSAYFGNGGVKRVYPALTSGFTFTADGEATNVPGFIQIRDASDDLAGVSGSTPGSTSNCCDYGGSAPSLSQAVPTVVGQTYRARFTVKGEGGNGPSGIVKLDINGDYIHVEVPGNEGVKSYTVEFTAATTNTVISFTNYGHFYQDNGGYCNPDTSGFCTVNGLGSSGQTAEVTLDNVELSSTQCATDYGDAPLTGTAPSGSGMNAYGEASHSIVSGIFMGAGLPDSDANNQATPTANGDDSDGNNDDDGVSGFPTLTTGDTNYVLPASNITAVGSGTLHAWIDFNGNGLFDTSEHALSSVSAGTLANDLIWSGQNTNSIGKTFARFRLTSDSLTNADAATSASDGEVEDYQLAVGTPDFVARPGSCGLYNHAGWLTPAGPNINTNILFGSNDPLKDPYVYAGLGRDAEGRILTSFGLPDETLSGAIPGKAGTELSEIAVGQPGQESEYHLTVFRLDGEAGTTDTVKFTAVGGADNIYAWIENTAGTVLTNSNEFIYSVPTTVNGGDGEEVSLTFTYPADGVVYLYGSLFDPSSYYGKTTVEDYSCPKVLSGVVFEDINYGGGAGRDQSSASGVGVNGVTVELYDNTGVFLSSTTTANDGSADGTYRFDYIDSGDYYIRVVNDTVGSTRGGADGSELAVQTFRSDGSTDTSNEVGGRNPAVADEAAYNAASPSTLNTTTFSFTGGSLDGGQAQSIQAVTVANSDVSEIEFGFNFDTVVNTNDAGQGSLRQFILNSNLLDNTGLDQVDNPADGATDPAPGVETSIFEIPGTGVHEISPISGLPAVTDSFTALDATTQQGASCVSGSRSLQVQLDGTNAGVNEQGLSIDASDAIIRGFAIGEFSEQGIYGSANADNLLIACNNVGMEADGNTVSGNGLHGIWIEDATNITIGGSSDTERNLVSGNTRHGISLDGVDTALVRYNYVGTDISGTSARSNNTEGAQYGGVAAIANARNINIFDNLISGNDKTFGSAPANTTDGIYLNTADTIDIKRNFIGTDADGLAALGNSGAGIYSFNTDDITVGGSVADRNVISANGEDGFSSRFGTDTVSILSNYIGVDINGTGDLGNQDNGIFFQDTANATVGNGTVAGRNVIAANDISGIRITNSGGTTVKGNYIGVDTSGMSSLGNSLHGIYIQNAADVEIGGSAVNDRNVISANGVIGVFVVGAVSDALIENNVVGLLSDADSPAGNGQSGVETVATDGAVITDNIISANGTRGIYLVNSPNTTVTDNLIGLNEAGTAARGNTTYGIDVGTAAANLDVSVNTISANGNRGIRIFGGTATNNTIQNNRIGVALDGTTAMGNTNGGVIIQNTSGAMVGGSGANDANIIANNTGDAVTILGAGANNNTVSRNVMYANTGLGIDLDLDNVTLNDAGDVDAGAANDGLNFPQFSQVTLISGNLTVAGCAPAGSTVELFEADVSPSSTSGQATGSNQFGRTQDYGEGEVFLRSWTIPATGTACALNVDADNNNPTGMLAFSETFALSSLPAGTDVVLDYKLTATATVASVGTSEFSAIGLVSSFDYGDAPLSGTAPSGSGTNNYGITQHAVVSGMSLGSSDPDIDASYQDSNLANGDDLNGSDDEDGILLPTLVAGDTAYSIVSADITAVGSGTLHAWIDFDGNGVFDPDEHSSTLVSSGSAGALNWALDGLAGNPDFGLSANDITFARFRFTSDPSINANTPASIASNGEVEDYAITVLDNTPDIMTRPGVCGGFVSRGWKSAAAGTLHDNDIRFNSGSVQNDPYAFTALRRQSNGKIISSFGTPLETITGSIPTRVGNNLSATARTDSGHLAEYHATIFRLEGEPGTTETVIYDTNGGAEYSAYWIEDEAGNVLSSADFVYTYASGGGIGESFDIPVTYPSDGVVYVYTTLFDPTQAYGRPTLLNYVCPTDYSDGLADGLDTPNGTVAASAYGEATHQLLSGIQLGATVTPDVVSTLAADDASDDAISSFPLLTDAMTSYQIAAADIAATGDGTLTAWIDFDGDGAYQQDEFASADVIAGVVQTDLDWTFTDIMAAGTTYARLRLTSNVLSDEAATETIDERSTLAALDGEVEDYAVTVTATHKLTGVIFEDINYGGGAGRDQTSASGAGVNGATVELYDASGTFIANTTTANNGSVDGAYEFTALIDGDYHVRVVSDSVNSTRSGSDGSELAVQTFRSDGTTDVTAEVGGRQPSLSDTTAHDVTSPSTLDTSSYAFTGGALDGGQSQSVTSVTLAGADIEGIDFGYNFDTIVNANDNGQGSLRQFILNSNLLTDEASLAQVGQTATWETSIFMIPAADLSSGVATIELDTALPIITGSSTAVDAGTQTSNIGNTNAGVMGTGGIVGVDGLTLPQYQKPEVEIDANDFSGLRVDSAGEVLIARLAIYDTDRASATIDKGGVGLTAATKLTIQNVYLGPRATGADPGAGERLGRSYDDVDFTSPPNIEFLDNLIAYSENSGIHADDTGGTYLLTGNELHHLVLSNSGQDAVDAGGTWTTIGNLMHHNGSSNSSVSSGGAGFELGAASNAQVSANSVIENNTLHSNFGPGIRLRNTVTNTTVKKNVIYDNLNAGVSVQLRAAGLGVESTITQNSIYNNGELGIDISHNTTNGSPDQVTLNDANDSDGGPNTGLNFPQFTRAVHSGSDLIIQGCAPTGSTVELFEADVSSGSGSGASVGDNTFGKTQDYGEGETYIATFEEGVGEDSTLPAVNCGGLTDSDGNDASGMSPFQWRMSLPGSLQIGDKVTATATIAGTGTSEFSAVATIAGQDYGDAPGSYQTTLISDGARHDVINDVYLGSAKPDVDNDGQPSSSATNDGADEDGIATFGALTTSDRTYSVTARTTNRTSETATLIAWIDFDRNGQFDADEAAIRSVSAGSSGANITLNWSNIPLDIQEGDTYVRVRLTTDSLNNREPYGPKLDGEVEDYPITITTAGVSVSGRVFRDINVNAANDAGEVGVTGLPVVLYDTANQACVSTRTNGNGDYVFEDVVAGNYQVYEASREAVPSPRNCGVAFAKDPAGYRSTTVNVTPAFDVTTSDITDKDFGEVKPPVFEPDNSSQILPGNVLFYAHRFSTPTQGTVSFTSVSGNNATTGWASLIYQDTNCNGKLDGAEGSAPMQGEKVSTIIRTSGRVSSLTPSITKPNSTWKSDPVGVTAGGRVCIINKVYAPSNVAANDSYLQEITALFDYNNAIAGTETLLAKDLTTAQQVQTPTLPATPVVAPEPAVPAQPEEPATPNVPATETTPEVPDTPYVPETDPEPEQLPVAATPVVPELGPSRLELRKTVRNIDQGTPETETVNSAEPGDTLEYRVYYVNSGTGPLTELVINDVVPPYTEMVGSADCGAVILGMTCVASPLGLDDSLSWTFTGTLSGGAGGSVSYRVKIDE
ncbi:GEVED domain-containing protein [Leucothrix pacifica]|nr:GEVED domain-containing protein [Leucothrix pacifica]